MSDIYPAIQQRLSTKFVNSEDFAKTLSLSLLTGQSIMYYGPGGYGKTEMVQEAMKVFTDASFGMIECTPATTVSKLFGGAVAETVGTPKDNGSTVEITRESIDFSRGPLRKDFFFLEETLDAPMQTLAALKSLMTARRWAGIKSQHQILIGATNVNPAQLIASLPEEYQNSYQAFLDRWLVVEHGWKTHTKHDYLNLVDGLKDNSNLVSFSLGDLESEKSCLELIEVSRDILELVSGLSEESAKSGGVVSPRAFKWAVKLLACHAFINGRDKVEEEDLLALSYLPAYQAGLKESLASIVVRLEENRRQECVVDEFAKKIDSVKRYLVNSTEPPLIKEAVYRNLLEQVRQRLSRVCLSDHFHAIRDRLYEDIRDLNRCSLERQANLFTGMTNYEEI